LDFDGWAVTMDANPLSVYTDLAEFSSRAGYPLFKDFVYKMAYIDGSLSHDLMKTAFRICKLYKSIENRLDSEWI